MRTLIVIPARYGAIRLPGKPLLRDTGRYLVQHVYEQARGSRLAGRVVVATDDQRICLACEEFGAETVLTPAACPSGTDRVAAAVRALPGTPFELVVNVQGDEPEMAPGNVDALIDLMARTDAPMGTLAVESERREEWTSSAAVKVVRDGAARALYFSRAPIPHRRGAGDSGFPGRFLKHLGIYAYRRGFLDTIVTLPPSPLEQTEMLEQLRVLEAGFPIAVGIAVSDSNGIDTPEQYAAFVARFGARERERGGAVAVAAAAAAGGAAATGATEGRVIRA